MPPRNRLRLAGVCRFVNAAMAVGAALYFLLAPAVIIVLWLSDPGLRSGEIPGVAWRLHRSLTPRYERWARERVASGAASGVALRDVPSTEWPMFGSVFYLWATEALQAEWATNPGSHGAAPREYARGAVEACADLILDPAHHTWVKTHWGENYLHTNNVFFRALIIAGLTSHARLTGQGGHLPVLRDQVETLASDLDASPFGVLEDYPGECYPIDVFAAIAFIGRADVVLGTDHSAFVRRAMRGFGGRMLDKRGLVPYCVDAASGGQLGPSRGVGMTDVCIFAPEVCPDEAPELYGRYVTHFWQERLGAAGFREFPKDVPGMDWLVDVDSGPVVCGFSTAGNAFALAAARVNGRLDHAWPLAAQVIVACWPLPHGTLLGTRLLSDVMHAPYLGEAAVLFFLTTTPHHSAALRAAGGLPPLVFLVLVFFYAGLGLSAVFSSLFALRKWRRTAASAVVPAEGFQFALWSGIMVAGLAFLCAGWSVAAALLFMAAQFLPRFVRRQGGGQETADR